MLHLKSRKKVDSPPPKYIALDKCTKIGRGFKNTVQLPYQWLSRQHLVVK